ncbi:hypothetical protein BKA63DRAFT_555695 [Paraphoma chrysanthemicola]|nr:hypothetical protein BKA63DRAFT_555695 [Paraphoma chrysanthemicola]
MLLAMDKVQSMTSSSIAFSSRRYNLPTYAGDAMLDEAAMTYTKKIWSSVFKDTGLQSGMYISQAHGDQSQQVVHGCGSWRLQKLQALRNNLSLVFVYEKRTFLVPVVRPRSYH